MLTTASRPLAVSRKGLTTVILTLTAEKKRNNVTKSPLSKCKRAINSRSSFLQLYLCLYLKVKSPIRGLAVGDLGMTLGASHGGTSILEGLKKRTNTLQYLVT